MLAQIEEAKQTEEKYRIKTPDELKLLYGNN